jgi:hypothetical protein
VIKPQIMNTLHEYVRYRSRSVFETPQILMEFPSFSKLQRADHSGSESFISPEFAGYRAPIAAIGGRWQREFH